MRESIQTAPIVTADVSPGRAAIDPTGLLLALAAAFLYSWKPVFIKINYAYGVDAPTQLVLRMGFSLPFYVAMGIWAWKQRQNSRQATDLSTRTILQTCAIGVVGYYVASILDTEGLARITARSSD